MKRLVTENRLIVEGTFAWSRDRVRIAAIAGGAERVVWVQCWCRSRAVAEKRLLRRKQIDGAADKEAWSLVNFDRSRKCLWGASARDVKTMRNLFIYDSMSGSITHVRGNRSMQRIISSVCQYVAQEHGE